MAVIRFEHPGQARAALRAIVSDPGDGAGVLESPDAFANLLGDLLPDAPREAGLLVAAVRTGIPAVLAGHAEQGTDAATVVRLAATSLAERTAFAPGACDWAVAELAIAMGIAGARELADAGPLEGSGPAAGPATDTGLPWAAGTERRTVAMSPPGLDAAGVRTAVTAASRDWKRLALALGAVVLALVAVSGLGAAYVYSRQPPARAARSRPAATPAAARRPARAPRRRVALCGQGPVSRALADANHQLRSFSWHLVSHACQGGWAAATIYAPSVGPGEAFLVRTAAGWLSGPLNGSVFTCSDLATAFVAPVPPQPVAIQLFKKVGLCRTR
jgi:hypothetical protein